MKIFLSILIFITGINKYAFGQTSDINLTVLKLIDSVKVSFCNNDTSKAIVFLEAIEKNYPGDAATIITNLALGELYLKEGWLNAAKEKFLFALNCNPINRLTYRNSDICNKILTQYDPFRAKADLCVSISQLYFTQNKYDSCIYYLNLADNKYLPYKKCGNGILMYKSYLSPYFAKYYLTIGDTVKAINRLLDFFMQPDGNTMLLTRKLKEILLLKWTQEQINKEVDMGLKELKFIRTDDSALKIHFTLFGHTIENYGYGRPGFYKQLYKKDESLKKLKSK